MTTRRQFIKSSALMATAAAAAALPPRLGASPAAALPPRLGASPAAALPPRLGASPADPIYDPAKARPGVLATAKGSSKMELTFEPFEAQMKHVFRVANSSRSSTPIVLTRITYQGYTGYGEASMPPYLGESQASVMAFLQRVDLSRFNNPFQLEEILAYVDGITTNNTAAKCAVDIALHDLVGKLMGQPWWKIWGWRNTQLPSTSVTVGLTYVDDDPSKGIDRPMVRQKAQECSGFNVIKVKLGNAMETDKTMIETIREVTDLPIVVDANQGWPDKNHALKMVEWLATKGVEMVEQPMSKYRLDDAAWLHDRSPLPLIADEACQRLTDVPALKGVYDGINIKLMKCTGMREAREMVSLAKALNMKVMMGCMTETSVAISAAAQFASQLQWADLDGNWLIANDCFTGMKIVEGRITLEDVPGIGVQPL